MRAVGLIFLWAVALAVEDAAHDVPPPGYAWPRAAVYQQEGWADLTGFEVRKEREGLLLRFRLDRTPNPAGAPLGFSLAILAAYLDTGPGGVTRLPGAGFGVPADHAADRVVLVSGWGARLLRLGGGEGRVLTARRRGEWVEVEVPIKTYRALYPVVGVYDPFSPLGFRSLAAEGGIWRLKGPPGGPRGVDVVGPWPGRVLRPLSREGGRLGVFLLALLSGLFIAWGVVGLRR